MSVCSKFIPNFFNKNKCQNCFKLKNHHNDQTLEKNQTVRTIIRCSFLFVTPECHSTLNNATASKVRKFQRRWFILYSDGELTYALDQSSLTLPQNKINLTLCETIRLAPDVHDYAIGIVYLDKVYYIRANSSDELNRWYGDLSQFMTNNHPSINHPNHNHNHHIQSTKQCIVVDAVHKIQDQQQQQMLNNQQPIIKPANGNPVFKLLSYVNDIKSSTTADCTNSKVIINTSDRKTYLNLTQNSQDDCTVIRLSPTNRPKLNKSLPDLRTQQVLESTNTKEQTKLNNSKCGWLMRKGQNSREWFRHWFVLKDTLLTYYRDQPAAESNSLLDGVFDLSLVKRVHSNTCPNQTLNKIYYPFTITMWNSKQYELAALSVDCRDEWIKLILASSQSQISYINCKNELHNNGDSRSTINRTTHSDAETAESSDSNEVFSNFNEKHHQMPSSPPLNRNAISRMKHKLKDNKNKQTKSDPTSPTSSSTTSVNRQSESQIDSGLASSDDLIVNLDSRTVDSLNQLRQEQIDQLESIESVDSKDSKDSKDSELDRIKSSIVELHKFCLNIINELQVTHTDLSELKGILGLSELKRNLIQKDILGLLLGNQLLNGSNNFQVDTPDLLLKQNEMKSRNRIDSCAKIEPPASRDQSADGQPLNQTDDESDRIYLTRKQFDILLNKNEQLEQRLRVSLRTLQNLNNELKESYQNYDHLEIAFLCIQNRFRSILKIKKDEFDLLEKKINYLTAKLVHVEKAYRSSLSKLAELQTAT